jgi:methionyl-tRNA formyltransferase
MGAKLVVEVLASPELLDHPRPQVGESTYAAKLTPETLHLTPDLTPAESLRVVALERAFIRIGARRMKVLRASSSDIVVASGLLHAEDGVLALGVNGGALELTWVQPEGSRAMAGAAWWAGARLEGDVEWD